MKKYFLIGAILIFLLGCIFVYQNIIYNDKKLHVVICDVGQGDAIFIRTPSGSDILIDGGPDNSVLNCLGRHMPLWDRSLELVLLSHPHADHLDGLITVSKHYKILSFASENLKNQTAGFSELMRVIANQNIKMRYLYAGDRFLLKDGLMIQIVGPSKEFLDQTSPGGMIGETGEFASLETLLTYGRFSALLTGDSQVEELKQAISYMLPATSNVQILQVPHHGSRFGLNQEILDVLNPKLAVISVGKNNKYGHPTPFILDLLKKSNIKTFRTDEVEDIEIISDGLNWRIK